MGCQSIAGLPPALNLPVPTYTPGWREALWELSVLPKNTTQCPRPGLEPGPLDLETSALTMKPPCLPILYYKLKFISLLLQVPNLNKSCSLQNRWIRCMFFANSRESSQVFYKINLIFLNLITLLNWVHAYLHIRYLTSPPIFLHCLMIPSEQSLTCTSITPDTPPREIFIDQK